MRTIFYEVNKIIIMRIWAHFILYHLSCGGHGAQGGASWPRSGHGPDQARWPGGRGMWWPLGQHDHAHPPARNAPPIKPTQESFIAANAA